MAEEKNNSTAQFEQRKNARIMKAGTPGAVVLIPSNDLTRELIGNVQNFDTAARRLTSGFFTNTDKAKYDKAQKIISNVLEVMGKGAKEICELAQTRYIPTPAERRQRTNVDEDKTLKDGQK